MIQNRLMRKAMHKQPRSTMGNTNFYR